MTNMHLVLKPTHKSNSFKTGRGWMVLGIASVVGERMKQILSPAKFYPLWHVNILSPPELDVRVIEKQELGWLSRSNLLYSVLWTLRQSKTVISEPGWPNFWVENELGMWDNRIGWVYKKNKSPCLLKLFRHNWFFWSH